MIYLDNAASTQIDPLVLEAMMPYLTEQFGNPGGMYKLGRDAKDAVEEARTRVANLIGARPEQIIFTSGATEANNMVFEITKTYLSDQGKKHIITTQIEHKSVLRCVERLVNEDGFEATYLGFPRNFRAYPEELSRSVLPNTGLVSTIHSSNEVGFSFDTRAIGLFCRKNEILFHTDCVQSVSYSSVNVDRILCDFATISSHKIHGPKGIGALYIREPERWRPMILGGENQEFGLRGGTENVAGIVGFGKACEILLNHKRRDGGLVVLGLEDLKSAFLKRLSDSLGNKGITSALLMNGRSAVGTKALSLRVSGVDAGSLVLLADTMGVCISAGSACNSKSNEPSHVLTALGLTPDEARSSFRVSFSRTNTIEETRAAADIIADCIELLLSAGNV